MVKNQEVMMFGVRFGFVKRLINIPSNITTNCLCFQFWCLFAIHNLNGCKNVSILCVVKPTPVGN